MNEDLRSVWVSKHTLWLGIAAVLLVLFSIWD